MPPTAPPKDNDFNDFIKKVKSGEEKLQVTSNNNNKSKSSGSSKPKITQVETPAKSYTPYVSAEAKEQAEGMAQIKKYGIGQMSDVEAIQSANRLTKTQIEKEVRELNRQAETPMTTISQKVEYSKRAERVNKRIENFNKSLVVQQEYIDNTPSSYLKPISREVGGKTDAQIRTENINNLESQKRAIEDQIRNANIFDKANKEAELRYVKDQLDFARASPEQQEGARAAGNVVTGLGAVALAPFTGGASLIVGGAGLVKLGEGGAYYGGKVLENVAEEGINVPVVPFPSMFYPTIKVAEGQGKSKLTAEQKQLVGEADILGRQRAFEKAKEIKRGKTYEETLGSVVVGGSYTIGSVFAEPIVQGVFFQEGKAEAKKKLLSMGFSEAEAEREAKIIAARSSGRSAGSGVGFAVQSAGTEAIGRGLTGKLLSFVPKNVMKAGRVTIPATKIGVNVVSGGVGFVGVGTAGVIEGVAYSKQIKAVNLQQGKNVYVEVPLIGKVEQDVFYGTAGGLTAGTFGLLSVGTSKPFIKKGTREIGGKIEKAGTILGGQGEAEGNLFVDRLTKVYKNASLRNAPKTKVLTPSGALTPGVSLTQNTGNIVSSGGRVSGSPVNIFAPTSTQAKTGSPINIFTQNPILTPINTPTEVPVEEPVPVQTTTPVATNTPVPVFTSITTPRGGGITGLGLGGGSLVGGRRRPREGFYNEFRAAFGSLGLGTATKRRTTGRRVGSNLTRQRRRLT